VTDFDLCPGTLMMHTIYDIECTDPECRELDITRHDLIVYIDDSDDRYPPVHK